MVIVGFGDSITAGVRVGEDESYLQRLGQRFECAIHNEGVAGNTSAQGLARLQTVLERKADICIVAFGMNDHVMERAHCPRVDVLAFRQNLMEICRALTAGGATPILCTIHPIIEGGPESYYYARSPQEWYKASGGAQVRIDMYSRTIREVAEACGVALADIALAWAARLANGGSLHDLLLTVENSGKDDGVHPSPEGHRVYEVCIAETIERALRHCP
ncbi:SGNH/GDSL hydrolase family protein [Paenibacillus sp. MBLB4367]|uniref:SGNH/GDSL hydrolase family protein n=1 Tax=Paenibacillus sp. MBLB4367 TaxID=3384767 RepID=UPI0039081D5C